MTIITYNLCKNLKRHFRYLAVDLKRFNITITRKNVGHLPIFCTNLQYAFCLPRPLITQLPLVCVLQHKLFSVKFITPDPPYVSPCSLITTFERLRLNLSSP